MGNRQSVTEGTPSKNETPSKPEEVGPTDSKDKENIFPTFPEDKHIDKTSIVNETFEAKSACDVSTELETSGNSINTSSLNDKYSSIALLDDELEEEKWEERTTVITKTDHENYVAAATSILQEVLLDVKTPIKGIKTETPPEDEATNISSQTGFASANTSLVSTYRTMDSDSEAEYESAAEVSYSVDASNNPADDSEIEFGNKLLDVVDITDNSGDIETALEGLKLQVADRDKTPRAEEKNIIDTHEEKNIIHQESENNTPVKLQTEIEHQSASEVSENVTTVENINEVAQDTSALDIIDTNCQADQNDDIEEKKMQLCPSQLTQLDPMI
eukprot:TRINITY_DN6375_c0_g1_i3.p1 TRINITY_DN6375_c0_g1~~TRINITY_DN6375_c0_g1_i3.p1  ORF type:complete len:331 (+),score=88.12 TRINITY_DN6375_c0_g1_i3:272-1264(+)